jgi:hypothetical protein
VGNGTTPATLVECPYGFFCPAGSSVGTSNRCPANFFCGTGSSNGSAYSCTAAVPLSAWFDADGDGDADAVASTAQGGVLLLRDSSSSVSGDCNDGLSRGMPVLAMASMRGLVYADVDGDGDDDVLGVTSSATVVLLQNNGSGFFADVTAPSGLMVAANRAVAVSVGDIDGDGDVDVFVSATASSSVLLWNNGIGVFTDVTATALRPDVAGAFGASTMMDVDGDGDLDVFVPMTAGNRLYVNAGNGTLVESGSSSGVVSYTGGGIVRGSAAADVDGDGDVDVLVFGSGPQQLYVNNGGGLFVDMGASAVAVASVSASAAANATSACFGDIDNDGDVDLVLGASASLSVVAVNNGSGSFAATALGSAMSANPVFVDVDGDGDVDVPAVGFVNGFVSPGFVGAGVASVRVLSRAGHRVCHGVSVVVRRSSDGAIAASRVVSSGSAPYDVHVATSLSGDAFDVEVSFPTGRRHDKSTQAALSGLRLSTASSRSVPLVVARDTPVIASVRLSPSAGVYGPGSTLTAVVRALGDESGLSAAASCTMNGVDVSSTFVDWRNGTYSFAYVVLSSHRTTSALAVTVRLVDARWGVFSDELSTVFGGGELMVDTTPPPLVSFNATRSCSPDDGAVTATVNQTVCLSCGSLSAEPFGCSIWVQVNASSPPQRIQASSASNSVMVVVGPLQHGQHPIVVAWAEDTAGNVGPSASLTWEVDLTPPEALWSPPVAPAHTNQTSMLFSFGCSRTNCVFDYAFGSSRRVRLGGNATSQDSTPATARSMDTILGALPRRFTVESNATVAVTALVNGVPVPVDDPGSNTTVEVKLDTGAWTDVRAYGSAFDAAAQRLSLRGLADGQHTLLARGRGLSDDVVDVSPWTHVWTVDSVSPRVSFRVSPPEVSASPQCTATFVLASDEDAASFEVQWWPVASLVVDDGVVNGSAWQRVDGSVLSLDGLTAATPYVLHARATDRAGNVGVSSSWRWSSGSCPSTASVAVALTAESYPAGADGRAVVWSTASSLSRLPAEVQYRVNGGPWLRTSDRPILLRGLNATTRYDVDVRPAVPCGCEATIPEQAAASVSWFTHESGPGRVAIVSAPALSSNSLYSDFVLTSTARDAWFEYSLDGGSFAGCGSALRVGPLATGGHNITVRSVDASGAFVASAQLTYTWTVVSLSSSSLTLTDLPDGSYSLTVWAVKESTEEQAPRTVRWVVDTAAPVLSAVLVSGAITNASAAVLATSCPLEAFADLCVFCAAVSVNGGASSRSCASNASLGIELAVDGVYEAQVIAIDAAGNVGPAQRLSWVRDTVRPNTTGAVNDALVPLVSLPLLSMVATNTSRLVFHATSSEAGGGLAVTLDGAPVGASLVAGPTVTVDVTSDGVHTVVITAVDGAGNADETPIVSRVFVDTTTPSTSVDVQPAVVTNVSTVVMAWRVSGESAGMLSRFELSSAPALALLPSYVTPDDGGVALRASLTLVGVSSGAYTVTARAVDAVGHVDAVGASFSFVVDLEAPSSRLVHSLTPFVNRTSVTVGVSASDALSSVSVYVRVDGGAWQGVARGAGETTTASLALADGAHRIECRGVDTAGNAQPPPYDGVDVTVDATPPAISVAAGAVPAFNGLSVVSIPVTVVDATATTVRGVLDDSVDTAVSRVGGGVVSVGVATDGNHTLTLRGTDAAGNVGVVTVSWHTDRAPPVMSLLFGSLSPFVRDAVAEVSVRFANEMFPRLCVVCWQYTLVSASGSTLTSRGACEAVSSMLFVYSSDGVASVDAFSVDAAGNVGGNASRVTWTWDRTAPGTAASVDGGVWLPRLGVWLINNATVTMALSSTEPAHFDVRVDGVALPDRVLSTVLSLSLGAGRRVVNVTAVDAAGNEDGSAAVVAVVVDVTVPPLPRFQLLHERGCFVLPRSGVFVCNSSDAVAFDASCSEADSNDTAPCFVQWRLETVLVSGGGGSSPGCVVESVGNATSGASWTRATGALVLPRLTRDGQYRVWWRAADEAGNVGAADSMLLWLDTTPPSKEPTFVDTPGAVSFLTTARFAMQVTGDASPGRLSFVYELTRGAVVEPVATAALPEPTNEDEVELRVGDLVKDESYSLRVWTQDQAGHRSAKAAVFAWSVASEAPTVRVVSRPSPVSGLLQPVFVFSAVWGNGSARQGVVPDASFLVSLVGVSPPRSPCDEQGAVANCSSWCNGTRCEYSTRLETPQAYTLQVQAVLDGRAGDVATVLWEYRRCSSEQYAVITGHDAIQCRTCPDGSDCSPASATAVVTQASIVARAGYWAPPSSDGSRFYRCLVASACKRPANGTASSVRVECGRGYTGTLCGVCLPGYVAGSDGCLQCPSKKAAWQSAIVGVVIVVAAVLACIAFHYRGVVISVVPVATLKVALSTVQVVAAADAGYGIPWPPTMSSLLRSLRTAWLDVSLLQRVNCGGDTLDFLSLQLISFLLFKAALLVVVVSVLAQPCVSQLLGAITTLIAQRRWRQRRRQVSPTSAVPVVPESPPASLIVDGTDGRQSEAGGRPSLRTRCTSLHGPAIFRASFFVLLLAYPSISLRVLQIYQCVDVDGEHYLLADLSVRCYTQRWLGMAVYSAVMGAVFVVGLPLTISIILFRRRATLFGDGSEETRRVYGFLYNDYGPSAWWWEVEELLRKLLLTAVVAVRLSVTSSPVSTAFALLISMWAHVLHALYAPWGRGTNLYMMQHCSLTVIVGVFFCGVILKLDGVDTSSPAYGLLSVGVVLLVVLALVGAAVSLTLEVARRWRLHAAARASGADKPSPLQPPSLLRTAGDTSTGSTAVAAAAVQRTLSSVVLLRQLVSRPLLEVRRHNGNTATLTLVDVESAGPEVARDEVVRYPYCWSSVSCVAPHCPSSPPPPCRSHLAFALPIWHPDHGRHHGSIGCSSSLVLNVPASLCLCR